MGEPDLRVLFRDESLVVIDKPPGLLVHPNPHERGAPTCLGVLRRELGAFVRTVHRIDRAASGLVVFALTQEAASHLAAQWRERAVAKEYLAIVRGHLLEACLIERPIPRDAGLEPVPSRTSVRPLAHAVLHEPVGRYPEGWFTLLAIELHTGRLHQARKHLHAINHPIIGDKKHGDRAQNRFFVQRFGSGELLLRAYRLRFAHPAGGAQVLACAGIPERWQSLCRDLGLELPPELAREPSVALHAP